MRFFFALISAIVGSISFYFMVSTPDYTGVLTQCLEDPYVYEIPYYTHAPVLDSMLCIAVDFFPAAAFKSGPIGKILLAYIYSLVAAISVFTAIEGGRKSAKGFVYLHGAMICLGIAFGIGGVFPLTWLTSYYLTKNTNKTIQHEYLSKSYVLISAFINYAFMIIMIATLFSPPEYTVLLVSVLQVAGIIYFIPTLYCIIFGYSKTINSAESAHSQTILVYYFYAGILSLFWAYIGFIAWNHSNQIFSYEYIEKDFIKNQYSWFLGIDCCAMMWSLFFFILTETGIQALLKAKLYSVFIGPGAAFMLYCAHRENAHFQRLGILASKKKRE